MIYAKGLTSTWKKVARHVRNNMKLSDPAQKKLEQDADICRSEIMAKNRKLAASCKSVQYMGRKRGA